MSGTSTAGHVDHMYASLALSVRKTRGDSTSRDRSQSWTALPLDGVEWARLTVKAAASNAEGWGTMTGPLQICSHIEAITTVKQAERRECEECVKIGAGWMHLRTCQECGRTLCCDESPNRHATKHAQASGHPVIASAEPGERWLYCYPDEAFVEY